MFQIDVIKWPLELLKLPESLVSNAAVLIELEPDFCLQTNFYLPQNFLSFKMLSTKDLFGPDWFSWVFIVHISSFSTVLFDFSFRANYFGKFEFSSIPNAEADFGRKFGTRILIWILTFSLKIFQWSFSPVWRRVPPSTHDTNWIAQRNPIGSNLNLVALGTSTKIRILLKGNDNQRLPPLVSNVLHKSNQKSNQKSNFKSIQTSSDFERWLYCRMETPIIKIR